MNEKRSQFGGALDCHIGISAISSDEMPAACAAKLIGTDIPLTGPIKLMNALLRAQKKGTSGGDLKTGRSETRLKPC